MAVTPVPVSRWRRPFLNDSKAQSTTLDIENENASERWTGRDIRKHFTASPVIVWWISCVRIRLVFWWRLTLNRVSDSGGPGHPVTGSLPRLMDVCWWRR